MFRRVLAWLGARTGDGGNDGTEEADEADDGTPFVPSRLDASVRFAHGDGDAAAEDEMAAVSEESQRLEEVRREP